MATGSDNPATIPEVSVIIPARNEEGPLQDCLRSLLPQGCVNFEIIVVDDNSMDATHEVAESFMGVRTIDAGPLPNGWCGKNHAASIGAQHARGKWLLFTDADTVHLPASLASALEEAREHRADMLSYSPGQDVHGVMLRAVMALIFSELACTYEPKHISDPATPIAAANGQYLLITREAYDAIGGHRAVAGDILEDVAIARLVKQSGRSVFFRYGDDIVRARMYRNFAQMCEGWTKNLALLFRRPLLLAFRRVIEFVLLSGGLIGLVFLRGVVPYYVSAAVFVGTSLLLFRRVRKAHFGWWATLISPLGLPVFAYLLARSKLAVMSGKVRWKGREYNPGGRVPNQNGSATEDVSEPMARR